MTMTAADVAEILGWLRAARVDVWLDGGWDVDALVGEQTRDHKDLDVIVRDSHEARMREVLGDHGFTQVRGVPQNFVCADETGREVDVHPVRFDDRGDGHLLSADGEPFGHSSEASAASSRSGIPPHVGAWITWSMASPWRRSSRLRFEWQEEWEYRVR